jgi:hypothetical protein
MPFSIMTLKAMDLIVTLSKTDLIVTCNIMAFSKTALNVMDLIATLSVNYMQHSSPQPTHVCYYT